MNAKKQHRRLKSFISSEYKNLIAYVKSYFNEMYYTADAEDIVQDVSVNLFSKLDFDEHLENIAGYVYRSLKNKVVDLQRKRKKEIPFERFVDREGEDNFSGNIEDISGSFYKEIDDERFYSILNGALKKLSPNQQMVFVATEFDGYTFDELSEKLGIPMGTLLSWKHRGVKKLKELIRPDDLYRELKN